MSPPKRLIAIVGPTATGKSRLGIELATRLDGEIVACDSTAVYRRFDIGTDKVEPADQRGVPHRMVDLVDPREAYSAARYAREAAAVIEDIFMRGRLPIVVGGTGFYYRALTRGLFPGPARDPVVRDRLGRVADRRGVATLHRWLARVDPLSAQRIHARDRVRLVRALEVWLLTRKPLSDHFADTRSPLPDCEVIAMALRLPAALTAERVAKRVDAQFARGVVHEVREILASGVPETAHPFSGLVYRQVLEYLHGVRGEAETRALIVRENKQCARRQLIWFRKEPNLHWLHGPGELPDAIESARCVLRARGISI